MKKAYIALLTFIFILEIPVTAKNYRFVIGTFTTNTSAQGIYSLTINMTDTTHRLKLAAPIIDPSFLALSNKNKLVYAVSERGEKSSVCAYRFDKKLSTLKLINTQQAGSATDPCHIAATPHHVVTANYSGGSVFVYPRLADGSLGSNVQEVQHTGSSINPTRQTKPHVHQVSFSPDNKFLLVNDLGTDMLTVYRYLKSNTNPLVAFDTLRLKAGSGPRHLTFDKSGKLIYLLHELDGSLSTIRFDSGKLTLIDTTSVVRKAAMQAGAADIHLSPDGKYLYATNRGNANDITCFKTSVSGRLSFVQQVSVEGLGPRNFVITNDGKYLLVGNQWTNNMTIFERNTSTGKLQFTGKKISLGAPVCLLEY
ncbi:MAG: hypothetical protein AUK44_01860 [Porphyromonadaceae bacterium CG2_30_38_12]|nr:MAG: hypothetical protein AUK44_01860 [Porphyromonadaceae bacterium CG2_30_38_12]